MTNYQIALRVARRFIYRGHLTIEETAIKMIDLHAEGRVRLEDGEYVTQWTEEEMQRAIAEAEREVTA